MSIPSQISAGIEGPLLDDEPDDDKEVEVGVLLDDVPDAEEVEVEVDVEDGTAAVVPVVPGAASTHAPAYSASA